MEPQTLGGLMTDRAIFSFSSEGLRLDDVPGFLYRLFSDPTSSRPSRNPASGGCRSHAFARRNTSRELYRLIGGGSPIRRLTEEQARGVENRLRARGRELPFAGNERRFLWS
jgi:protoheme ferro-lyase